MQTTIKNIAKSPNIREEIFIKVKKKNSISQVIFHGPLGCKKEKGCNANQGCCNEEGCRNKQGCFKHKK